ncbi:MAG: hypothetical protein WKF75_04900 [Singulisphaera sp.]
MSTASGKSRIAWSPSGWCVQHSPPPRPRGQDAETGTAAEAGRAVESGSRNSAGRSAAHPRGRSPRPRVRPGTLDRTGRLRGAAHWQVGDARRRLDTPPADRPT